VGRHEIPIYEGCARPMVNDLVTAEYVHGESGLDGPELPLPTRGIEPRHAVDFLVDTLRAASPRSITICLIGPMTNMGMALVKAPEIVSSIAEFVIMGGSFHAGGNVTATAEFNVYVDPHAAHVVLSSGVAMTFMPLDVTHQAQATPERVAAFRALGAPVGDAVGAMLDFVGDSDVTHHGFEGFPLHDPTVIAYLIEPEIFTMRPGRVTVVTDAGAAHGMTIADWHREPPNAQVALELDAGRFYELLLDRLGRY
jgi:purine nucleosidase